MKRNLLLCFLLMIFAGVKAQTKDYSPCSDSTYLSLKAKSINSMTEREFAYFSQKDKECAEYIRVKDAEEKARIQIKEQEERTKAQIKAQERENEKMMQDIKKKTTKAYIRSILWLGLTFGVVFLLL